MIPGVDMNHRQQLEAKYKKLNSGLRFVAAFLLIVAAAVVFLPGWVLEWINSKRHLRSTDHSNDPSLFHQYGFTAIGYTLAAAAVLFIIIALLSGWFGLRKKLR
jgi:ABC-type Fe3+ transport system permease subunit